MQSNSNIEVDTNLKIPCILRGKNILVPLKIDLTAVGARYVDSFCWNINSKTTTNEFAARTCSDMNLIAPFQTRIALQMSEQIESYISLIDILKEVFVEDKLPNIHKLREPIYMQVCIRLHGIEYLDKFMWNPMSDYLTPEIFARNVCVDQSLPCEMEVAIAHKIRENLFRNFLTWLENPKDFNLNNPVAPEQFLSEVKVSALQPHHSTDMLTNLWKRAKPNSELDIAGVPQPSLPDNKLTNAQVWSK